MNNVPPYASHCPRVISAVGGAILSRLIKTAARPVETVGCPVEKAVRPVQTAACAMQTAARMVQTAGRFILTTVGALKTADCLLATAARWVETAAPAHQTFRVDAPAIRQFGAAGLRWRFTSLCPSRDLALARLVARGE